MKKPFNKYSDAEQALYVLGFNLGYQIDKTDLKKATLMNALEKEFRKGKTMHPFSEGLFDGIDTNEQLKSFLYERLSPENKYRDHDEELAPDL